MEASKGEWEKLIKRSEVIGSLEHLAGLAVQQDQYDLAETSDSKGQYPLAEPFYKQSLAILEVILGPNRGDVAECLEQLAVLCRNTNRVSEAKEYERRAEEVATAGH